MSPIAFQKLVLQFYAKNRRSFPWRETSSPYEILVSEMMLQQTQTHRVIPKYLSWLQEFPSIHILANASLGEVLRAWSGLGYNRRAKFLWETAKELNNSTSGTLPDTYEELVELPGIGEYTANALLAFAYNRPVIVLETNIRTALLHHFFAESSEKVSDRQLKELLPKVINKKDPRNWYYALMDYGNWLKSEGISHFHLQKAHTKQKPFKGSERFIRGFLVRQTLESGPVNTLSLKIPGYTQKQIRKVTQNLLTEGLVKATGPGIISVV